MYHLIFALLLAHPTRQSGKGFLAKRLMRGGGRRNAVKRESFPESCPGRGFFRVADHSLLFPPICEWTDGEDGELLQVLPEPGDVRRRGRGGGRRGERGGGLAGLAAVVVVIVVVPVEKTNPRYV